MNDIRAALRKQNHFSLLSNEMENAIDKPGNSVDNLPTCTRFVSMNNCDIERAIEKMTPEATRKKTEWAVRVFRDWHKWKNDQNILSEAELSVFDDIDEMSKGDLNFLLQKFVFEVRKKSNESYPPKTLYDLFAMINYHVQNNLKRPWSLFKDIDFQESRKCLEAAMRDAAERGLTSGNNRAEAITTDQENHLWNRGILGKSNPQQLTHTMVYLIGLHFCLRGGKELRRLRYGDNSQIKKKIDSSGVSCLVYKEDISKCRQGGIKTIGSEGKTVHAYHNENHERCLVCLFDFYISKRPDNVTTDALFLAYNHHSKNGQWFKNMSLGEHSLRNVVKTVTEGLPGRYTNQSLRRTSATRLFQAGYEEDIVCRITGHRSSAVRVYKTLAPKQQQLISANLCSSNADSSRTDEIYDVPHKQARLENLFSGTFTNCTFNISK